MASVIVSLFPLILGSALVPVQIIVVLLLLTSQSKGLAKAIGFVLGMTLARVGQGIFFGLIFTGGNGSTADSDESGWIVSTLLMVLGILLLITAFRSWRGEPDPDAPPPRWMTMMDKMTPLLAVGMGAGLILIGAKLWVFTLGALGTIGDAMLGQPSSTIAFLIYIFLAQSLLIIPILAGIILPERSAAWFASLSAWLDEHNSQIVTAVSLVFGLFFLYKGLSGLL